MTHFVILFEFWLLWATYIFTAEENLATFRENMELEGWKDLKADFFLRLRKKKSFITSIQYQR